MGWFKKALLVFVVLILVSGVVFWLTFFKSPIPARLTDVQGVVEVQQAGAWITAANGTLVHQSDSIRTKEGTATIVFFGASILRLDTNTTLELTTLDPAASVVVVTQPDGKSWNRVVHAVDAGLLEKVGSVKGIKQYSLKTPNAVATVRGTSFAADADSVDIVTGIVAMTVAGSTQEFQHQSVVTDPDKMIPELLDTTEDWIVDNQAKDDAFDRALLAQLRQKYGWLIPYVKRTYGVTDEQIDEHVLAYLKSGGTPLPQIPGLS